MDMEKDELFRSLIIRIAENDKMASEEFYAEFSRFIKAIALSITEKETLADEITVDITVKIISKAKKYARNKVSLGWLYTMCKNYSLDVCKHEKIHARRNAPLDEELALSCSSERKSTDNPFAEYFENDIISKLTFEELIEDLNDTEKQIIIFKIILGLTFSEISEEMGVPLSSVTAIYYRALKKIEKNA